MLKSLLLTIGLNAKDIPIHFYFDTKLKNSDFQERGELRIEFLTNEDRVKVVHGDYWEESYLFSKRGEN